MLLTMDIGNTNINIGLFQDDELTVSARLATERQKTDDQYAMDFTNIFVMHKIQFNDISGVVISSVVFREKITSVKIISLVMMFVYGRLIVCKDFMIYDSPLNGFIRYFLRFVLSGLYLFMSIIEILSLDKKSIFIKKNHYFFEVLLLISSVIILVFSTNYIGIISLLLMIIFV